MIGFIKCHSASTKMNLSFFSFGFLIYMTQNDQNFSDVKPTFYAWNNSYLAVMNYLLNLRPGFHPVAIIKPWLKQPEEGKGLFVLKSRSQSITEGKSMQGHEAASDIQSRAEREWMYSPEPKDWWHSHNPTQTHHRPPDQTVPHWESHAILDYIKLTIKTNQYYMYTYNSTGFAKTVYNLTYLVDS